MELAQFFQRLKVNLLLVHMAETMLGKQ